MGEDQVLLYPLAGMLSIILAVPLLMFWPRKGGARWLVILTLLLSIAAGWWLVDLSQPKMELQNLLFLMTLLPPMLATLVAGMVELKLRADHRRKRRYKRKRRADPSDLV